MKKYNLLTNKDRIAFTRLRNRSFGSLHWSRVALQNIINTDIVSDSDKLALQTAKVYINDVIKYWDKHYCAKLFKQMEAEKCQQSNQQKQ